MWNKQRSAASNTRSSVIGQGAFGVVTKRRSEHIGGWVVIKVGRTGGQHCTDRYVKQSFDRELWFLGTMKHPAIVKLVDHKYDEELEQLELHLELASMDLKELIERHKSGLPEARAKVDTLDIEIPVPVTGCLGVPASTERAASGHKASEHSLLRGDRPMQAVRLRRGPSVRGASPALQS